MRKVVSILFICTHLFCFSQLKTKSLNQCHWKFKNVAENKWMPAKVPGTVHTDLLSNKIIPEPYYGNNEKSLQWIEEKDWEYQCYFNISKSEFFKNHIELELKGLDTYAGVYVNDSLVLTADNMFREWNIDVKKYVCKGKNKLKIVFYSAVKKGKEAAAKLRYTLPGDEKVFTRKAQYQYGWDWGPRFVTCGIWKDVGLVFWDDAKINHVKYVQNVLTDSVAHIEFVCTIESDKEVNAFIDAGLDSESDNFNQRTEKIHLQKGIYEYSIPLTIRNPQRWWIRDLGESFLYNYTIDLTYNSKVLDKKQIAIGLRTIELVNEKDSIGTSFYFKLNGRPVFMKGANYIPQDNFVTRITLEKYERAVLSALDANMNMLRVWGGGIYEQDEFYELCDQLGILVWQDMMFACAMYPADSAFLNNVSNEVTQQVQRLRNHPAIALWCGNNEIDEGWKNWGWQKQYNYSYSDSTTIANNYQLLFEKTIKDLVNNNDDSRAYWPSSPSIGWGHKESLTQGDAHYWGVWWGMEPFEIYNNKVGRFMSEYGFQGMPQASTLFKVGLYAPAKKKNENYDKGENVSAFYSHRIDSTVLNAHQKHPKGFETIHTYMQRDFKVPVSNYDSYTYISQLVQAKGLKTAIEAHRRNKPYCMGTLYWQLNDCWPVTSWSSVDYFGNYKAAHYEVKRLYKDVIISVDDSNADSSAVYIVSDYQKTLKGELRLSLCDFNGKVLWSKMKDVVVASNSSQMCFYFDKSILNLYEKNKIVLRIEFVENNYRINSTVAMHYFVKEKELDLIKGSYKVTKVNSYSTNSFSISSNVLLKNAMITIDGKEFILNDNYFDMFPGTEYFIYLPFGEKIKNIDKKIKIVSLVDTY